MKRIRAFLRELFSLPRDATPPARDPAPVKRPGPTPVTADVARPRGTWLVFQNRRYGYKEEESIAMGRWSRLRYAVEELQSLDPESGCPDWKQRSLLFDVLELAADDTWPLESMTRAQAFAALARSIDRIAHDDGRTVLRLLLQEVHEPLAQSRRAFEAGDTRAGLEALQRARIELDIVLSDVRPQA